MSARDGGEDQAVAHETLLSIGAHPTPSRASQEGGRGGRGGGVGGGESERCGVPTV